MLAIRRLTYQAELTDDAVRDRQSRHHTRGEGADARVPAELIIRTGGHVVMLPLTLHAAHECALR